FKTGLGILLKDSVPCPIPNTSEVGDQPPLLLDLKIPDAADGAITNLRSRTLSSALPHVLLLKRHKMAIRALNS
ncbi:hypothetical protein, partial [Rhizobium sp. Leaf341]|uniref:hypothetical protein n=1 Tax=Rhizobium sp. Leaf341 TaxID=1736344 RepID=UPI001AEBB886